MLDGMTRLRTPQEHVAIIRDMLAAAMEESDHPAIAQAAKHADAAAAFWTCAAGSTSSKKAATRTRYGSRTPRSAAASASACPVRVVEIQPYGIQYLITGRNTSDDA